MWCIAYLIILILWTVWAVLITKYLNQTFNITLDHVFRPKVNLQAKNDSASRYDGIEVKKWQIYIGAIFLIPLRIVLICPVMIFGTLLAKIICLIFNCNF